MENKIKQVVSEICGISVENIYPASMLREVLGLDDLDIYTLLTELEEEFSLETPITDKVGNSWVNVQDIIDYMNSIMPDTELAEDMEKRVE